MKKFEIGKAYTECETGENFKIIGIDKSLPALAAVNLDSREVVFILSAS